MPLNDKRTRQHLSAFDFEPLFIDELGWDRHTQNLEVSLDDQTFALSAIAQKRGMIAFACNWTDGHIPNYAVRRKIEHQLSRSVHEHLIIYADKLTQIWQWVKREPGKPTACREHTYYRGQPGDALIQKLAAIAFSLDEEERLTIVDVAGHTRAAFDVERVTRRFYDRFKTEHAAFLRFLKGIPGEELQRWYASVMINRLMFIYFIQKKGFLDSDLDYLRNKLKQTRLAGRDRFYADFLYPLFFEGFARKEDERPPAVNQLLGTVPYLNGGIFQLHQLEKLHGKSIHIADAAFEKLLSFFEQYQWHLDERPLRRDDEINPDVLGYIFEKYINHINQKQMGAYYTKEDITGYISQNTVIPRLFDIARQRCKIAFEGESSVWRLLQDDPDRYIYEAMKKGVELSLPGEIAIGLDDVSRRTEWNRPAPEEYALPREIWREVVARRKRCEEVKAKLAEGEIRQINDLITYNLNIHQFALDVIEASEGPELLRAFWHALARITVLDPACGSGAFLFAALNILEPLYEACLNRMQVFLDELERSGEKHRPEKFSDFRQVLAEAGKHPNLRYFILKSIILNNLYGVDIMEEAVEICRLRLFLKLVAQVENVGEIEPLPDIDFNICAGNTLVGFTTREEIKLALTMGQNAQIRMLSTEDMETMQCIDESAEIADRAFRQFRQMQTQCGMDSSDFADAKRELRRRLRVMEDELNMYLASEYGVVTREEGPKGIGLAYQQWLASHKPFHWFVNFYGIMKNGGFDVIIGNPPFVEYSKVKSDYTIRAYETESCGNLYAFMTERALTLLRPNGRFGMIVQLPIVCTDRMKPLQMVSLKKSNMAWFANFDDRPARLFDGLEHIRACIFTLQKHEGRSQSCTVFTTIYNRWYTENRPTLFALLSFLESTQYVMDGAIPKIGDPIAKSVRQRIEHLLPLSKSLKQRSQHTAYFHNSPQYWIRAMDFAPYFWNERDGEQVSSHIKLLELATDTNASVVISVLNSSLFYWWFIMRSNCRDLTMREIENFPIGIDQLSDTIAQRLAELARKLIADLKQHSQRKRAYYQTTGEVIYDEFYPKHSKPIIDEIDRVLAQHYGFTDEELDFIINYDIKYRMGRDGLQGNGE